MKRQNNQSFLIKLRCFLLSIKNRKILIIHYDKFKIVEETLFFSEIKKSNEFKLSKLNSFYRQLNLYDFKKIRSGKFEGYYFWNRNNFFEICDEMLKKYNRKVASQIMTSQKINKDTNCDSNTCFNKRKSKRISSNKANSNVNTENILVLKEIKFNYIYYNVTSYVNSVEYYNIYLYLPKIVYIPVPHPVKINERHISILDKYLNFPNDYNNYVGNICVSYEKKKNNLDDELPNLLIFDENNIFNFDIVQENSDIKNDSNIKDEDISYNNSCKEDNKKRKLVNDNICTIKKIKLKDKNIKIISKLHDYYIPKYITKIQKIYIPKYVSIYIPEYKLKNIPVPVSEKYDNISYKIECSNLSENIDIPFDITHEHEKLENINEIKNIEDYF
jgi:hypothetical protein